MIINFAFIKKHRPGLHLSWLFYKPIAAVCIIFSAVAWYKTFKDGASGLAEVMFIKTAGYMLCMGFYYMMPPAYLFFFRNAGYRLSLLWFAALLIDMLIFLPPFAGLLLLQA